MSSGRKTFDIHTQSLFKLSVGKIDIDILQSEEKYSESKIYLMSGNKKVE